MNDIYDSFVGDVHDCLGQQLKSVNFESIVIGEHDWWEFSLKKCRHCGAMYLHAFLDSDGMPRSGRWYIVPLKEGTQLENIRPESALKEIASQKQVFAGGSYYDSAGHWTNPGAIGDLIEFRESNRRPISQSDMDTLRDLVLELTLGHRSTLIAALDKPGSQIGTSTDSENYALLRKLTELGLAEEMPLEVELPPEIAQSLAAFAIREEAKPVLAKLLK